MIQVSYVLLLNLNQLENTPRPNESIKTTESSCARKNSSENPEESIASFCCSPCAPNSSAINSKDGSFANECSRSCESESLSERSASATNSPLARKSFEKYSINDMDIVQSQHAELEDFHLIRIVGKGGFAKVYQVKRKSDGKIFALKVMRKEMLKKLKQVECVILLILSRQIKS